MPTFSAQVSQSTDDGSQNSSGTVTLTGGAAVLSVSTWLAARFQNVTIPSGATISAATLSLWATTAKTINSNIFENKLANPSTLSSTTNYISGLSQTSQSANWAATLTSGAFNTSPSISSIVSALIGLGGWASGNAMLFVFQNTETMSLAVAVEMYDGTPSEAAELSVTYTAPAGGGNSMMVGMMGFH